MYPLHFLHFIISSESSHTCRHTSRPSSSHDSMLVKSGPSLDSEKSGGASIADTASIAPASTTFDVLAESGALEDHERWGYNVGVSEVTMNHHMGELSDSRVLETSQLMGSSLQNIDESTTNFRSGVFHHKPRSGHVHQISGLSVNTSLHQSRLTHHFPQESYGGVSFDVGPSGHVLESGDALKGAQSNVQFESNVFSSAVSKW